MVLLKTVDRPKPSASSTTRPHPPPDRRLPTPIEPTTEATREQEQRHEKSSNIGPDAQLTRDLQNAVDLPTPDSPKSSVDATEDEPRQPRRKRGTVGHTLRLPRPPFLPPYMRGGCVQTTKFKHLKAPGAPEGRGGWESFNYCLDCLRYHQIIYCDGDSEFKEQTCRYHEQKYVTRWLTNG
jgi:hypothetical protein